MTDSVAEPDLLAGVRTGAWLDAQVFPPLSFVVPGVIPEGSTLLVGPPKIGKSWFVLAVALAVASGGYVLSAIQVERRPVLYLALEDGDRRLQDRCRTLLCGDPIPAGFQYLTDVQPGMVVPVVEAWLCAYGHGGPVVILDTLGKVMPPAYQGESSYQRDYRVGATLKALVTQHIEASLVVTHHDRKAAADDFVDSVSGTHGLAGAADTVIVLNRARQDITGSLRVTGRDVEEGEYALRFEGLGMWRLAGSDLDSAAAAATEARAVAGVGDRSAEILAFVATHAAGVRAGDVASALRLEQHQARTYLSRLYESGRLERIDRGVYTSVASVALLRSDEADQGRRNSRNSRNTPSVAPSERPHPGRTVPRGATGAVERPTGLVDVDLDELIDPPADGSDDDYAATVALLQRTLGAEIIEERADG